MEVSGKVELQFGEEKYTSGGSLILYLSSDRAVSVRSGTCRENPIQVLVLRLLYISTTALPCG